MINLVQRRDYRKFIDWQANLAIKIAGIHTQKLINKYSPQEIHRHLQVSISIRNYKRI
jgi:hypothetical protein